MYRWIMIMHWLWIKACLRLVSDRITTVCRHLEKNQSEHSLPSSFYCPYVDTKKYACCNNVTMGLQVSCRLWSHVVLQLYMTHAHTSQTLFPLLPNKMLRSCWGYVEVMPLSDRRCYDNWTVNPVWLISFSRDTCGYSSPHSLRSAATVR